MIKISLIILLIFINFSTEAGEKELREIIEKTYPELTIKSIQKTQYNDLYEIYIGGQIIYSDESFSFLIVEGRVVDPKTKVDLTTARLEELNKVDFNSLPFKNAINDRIQEKEIEIIELSSIKRHEILSVNLTKTSIKIKVLFETFQIRALMDKDKKIIDGDKDNEILVKDEWVFERKGMKRV